MTLLTQLRRVHKGSHTLKSQAWYLQGSGTQSSVHMLRFLAWCFVGPTVGAGVSLILFLLLGYLVQRQCEDFCLMLLYFVLSCLVVSWKPALF